MNQEVAWFCADALGALAQLPFLPSECGWFLFTGGSRFPRFDEADQLP